MKSFVRLLTLSAFLFALPAVGQVVDFSSNDLLIPIAGRTPGAFGSQWRTDLTVTNVSTHLEPSNVFLTFTRTDGVGETFISRTLNPAETVVLNDVIQNAFGSDRATGIIRITSPNVRARLTANARIYNAANPVGEFGQGVQALPVDALT